MIGLELAAALLLAVAGWSKFRRPGVARSALTAARLPGASRFSPRLVNRSAGIAELLVAIGVIAVGGRIGALLLLLVFASLALVAARMVRVERGQDCGCFGRPTPVTHWHTAVNLVAAVVGAISLIWPGDSIVTSDYQSRNLVVLAGATALAYLGYLVMTALPDLLATVADLEATL